MKLDITYETGNSARTSLIGEDQLYRLYKARQTMKRGREAAVWLQKMGVLRKKTEEEIREDLKNIKKQKPKRLSRECVEEETLEAWEIYKKGKTTMIELAEEYGITPNSLSQRFQSRGLSKRGLKK